MAKRMRLRDIADEIALDLDEALVRVWDAGVDEVDDVDQYLSPDVTTRARRALGLAGAREMQQIAYWQAQWGFDRAETVQRLDAEYGVQVSPQARVLPKGALRKLRRTVVGPAITTREVPEQRKAPTSPLIWKPPGRKREAVGLQFEEICQIHQALVEEFSASGDPIEPSGVREEHLLHSAIGRPQTSIGGIQKYDTVEVYAAALLHSLVHNHAFFNSNKRTALVSMLVMLDRNNVLLTCTQDELFKHVLRVAQHGLVAASATARADHEVLEIARWICANSRAIQRGERVIKWKDLRRVLVRFHCEISSPLPGNKVKIERDVAVRARLGFKRKERLKVTFGYRNEGMEVEPAQVNYLRRDLRLADADGYDSEHFYGTDPREPDAFISEYRTLLRRLARL